MALSALVGPLIGVDRNSKAIGIDLLKGSGGEDNRPAPGEPTLLPIREAKGRMRLDKVRSDAELKAALKALIATMGLPSNAEDKDLSPYRHTCADQPSVPCDVCEYYADLEKEKKWSEAKERKKELNTSESVAEASGSRRCWRA